MKYKMLAAIVVIAAAFGSGAGAKQYVDYAPEKGVWNITAIEVDPNHVDDYLTGLRKTQEPLFKILKAHGLVDDWKYLIRNGYNKGTPNVLIELHFVSMTALEPNQAQDEAIEKEVFAKLPDAEGRKAVAEYEKYRTFVDDGLWTENKIK